MADETPVDELEGRELDAAVHVEVFGHEIWSDWADGSVDTREATYRTRSRTRQAVPRYSAYIAAAWQVVGAVDWGEGGFGLTECPSGWMAGRAGTPDSHEFHPSSFATADTAPEAICRAALRAARSSPD